MPIQFYEPDADIEILGRRFPKGDILAFKDVPLATAEVNKNLDDISAENVQSIAETVALQPISDGHREGQMIGIFTEGRVVDNQPVTSGLIYKKHTDPKTIKALSEGKKFLSVEAGADEATCSVCGATFTNQSNYCNHLQARRIYGAKRSFKNMYCTGGGVVDDPAGSGTRIPGVTVYASIDNEVVGRDYSVEERVKFALDGKAMSDGSFPIVDEKDVENSVLAFVRGGAPAEVKAHIIKRAKAVGAKLPSDWLTAQKGKGMSDKEEKKDVVEEDKEKTEMKAELIKLQASVKTAEETATKLEAEKKDLSTKLEAATTEIATLKNTLSASKEAHRKAVLVNSGIMTDKEFTDSKDTLMAMEDKGIEILASKATKPAGKVKIGGIANVQNADTESKPKLQYVNKS